MSMSVCTRNTFDKNNALHTIYKYRYHVHLMFMTQCIMHFDMNS